MLINAIPKIGDLFVFEKIGSKDASKTRYEKSIFIKSNIN